MSLEQQLRYVAALYEIEILTFVTSVVAFKVGNPCLQTYLLPIFPTGHTMRITLIRT